MDKSRREFLKNNIVLACGTAVSLSSITACSTEQKKSKSLSILILGGTSFLGPHQIHRALENGHSVSIFTRGKTMPTVHKELFSQVEHLIGDRADNLSALENRKWDVVIDNSGHNVEWTKATAELLKGNVSTYVFTSSTGVYYPYLKGNIMEDSPILEIEPETFEEPEMELEYWYAVMKGNSEKTATEIFGKENTILARPTYMMGPGDKSDRFIHWPLRLAKDGDVLVPGKQEDRVQYIDVRDVADWMIMAIERKLSGAYNLAGPKAGTTMQDFLIEAQKPFNVESNFIYIPDHSILKENNIPYLVPWIMPDTNNYGSARVNNDKAVASGLTFRPLPDSIQDIYQWWNSDALTDERRAEFEQKEGSVYVDESKILEDFAKKYVQIGPENKQ